MAKAKQIVSPLGFRLSAREERVVKFMNQHKSISAAQAEEHLHNHRLSATIHQLRKKGYDIETIRVDMTNVYGEACWYGKYVFKKK